MKQGKQGKAVGLVMACCLTWVSMADLSMPVQAATQDNEEQIQVGDDVYATLDMDGTLTISGTGDMWDNAIMQSEWNEESNCPWFGDWEHNPSEASKIVDKETGEPLVVYRGINNANYDKVYAYYTDSKADAIIYSRGQFTKGGQFFANNNDILYAINAILIRVVS